MTIRRVVEDRQQRLKDISRRCTAVTVRVVKTHSDPKEDANRMMELWDELPDGELKDLFAPILTGIGHGWLGVKEDK